MAQYDGSIRINTELNTQNASAQMMSLANRIVKTADKIASLRAKMDSLRDAKIPTQAYQSLEKELASAEKEMERMLAQNGKLTDVDAKIQKLSQSAAEYAAKMKEVASQKIPTYEYSEMQKELSKAEKNADSLYGKLRVMEQTGDTTSKGYLRLTQQIKNADQLVAELRNGMVELEQSGKAFTLGTDTEQYKNLFAKYESINSELEKQKSIYNDIENKQANASNRVDEIKNKMAELVREGKAFTLGRDTEEFAQLEQQLGYLQNDYEVLQQRQREMLARNRETVSSFRRLADAAKSALKKIIGSFNSLNKSTKSTNVSMKSALKAILKYGLGIRSVYVLINKFRTAVKEGFANLAQFSAPVNESLSMLKSSLLQLKNSLATAFAPILTTIAPLLKTLIDMISQAATYVGMFIATLTGASTFTKAIAVQEDYAASLNKTGSAAKKAAGTLAKFDDLDVLAQPTSSEGGAGAAETPVTDMFEEVPIDSKIASLADKFREVMSSLFAPLKESWNRDGESVMDSWKYALQETHNLMKDIGRDFLTMWNEEATVQMFSDMLRIAEDIGLVIGNLAHNLDEAWNKNQIGLQILENIRDIFAIIIEHIRNAADATVIWSEKLDFYPLSESVTDY